MAKGKNDKGRYRKEESYRERHRFWAGQALTQFAVSNNFFIIAGIAMLGYFVNELKEYGFISLDFCEDRKQALLSTSILLIFFSLFSGSLTMLSRLHDLRLTRHKLVVRIKALEENITFKEEYIDLRKDESYIKFVFNLLYWFLGTLLSNKYFLTNDEILKKVGAKKYKALRKRALMLGRFSWLSFNWQITWFASSIISYMVILIQ
jgi:hypothetical protein